MEEERGEEEEIGAEEERGEEEERGGHEMNVNNYTDQSRPPTTIQNRSDQTHQINSHWTTAVVHSTYLLSLLEGFVGNDLGPRLSGGVGSAG